MVVTKTEIKEHALRYRGDVETYNRCYEINDRIKRGLKSDLGIEVEMIHGEFKSTDSTSTDGHYFLYVPASELQNTEKGVIVDGAAGQFNEEYVMDESRDVSVAIADTGSEIDNVIITHKGEDLYGNYGL